MIRQNLGYKILALVAAIGLWFYVTGEKMSTPGVPVSVKLDVRNLPRGLQVAEISRNVTITLAKGVLPADAKDQIQAYVDLNGLRKGAHQLAVLTNRDDLVVNITPAVVAVILDRMANRAMPIVCQARGTPPAGYRLDVGKLDPPSAVITGYSEAVSKVVALTVPVNAAGRYDLDGWFPVKPVDSAQQIVAGVAVKPETVHLILTARQTEATKVLLISSKLSGHPAPGYVLVDSDISPAEVTVTGPPEVLAKTNLLRTDPMDITGATGDISRQIGYRAPRGLLIQGPTRAKVTIHIQKATGG